MLHLPVGFLQLLTQEARALDLTRRAFVWLLHQRGRGMLAMERKPSTTKWRLPPDQRDVGEPYRWFMNTEERESIEAARKAIGFGGRAGYALYVILLLCDWMGIHPLEAGGDAVGDVP